MSKIYLIGCGEVDAQPAENVKVGDTLMWNYGVTCKVLSVDIITKQAIKIKVEHLGNIYQGTFCKNDLICIL